MATLTRQIQDLILSPETFPTQFGKHWRALVVSHEECLSYVVWHELTREALLIDPLEHAEARAAYDTTRKTEKLQCLAVIDSHTHADHLSSAPEVARAWQTSYVTHEKSSTSQATLRVTDQNQTSLIQSQSAPLTFVHTPGHTTDAMSISWGPFLFTGDTVLYGDTGRDDLPGGNPEAHFEGLSRLKTFANPDQLMMPGHDGKGGRITTWKKQLEINASLTQDRATFVKESSEFKAAPPKLLMESLRHNTR